MKNFQLDPAGNITWAGSDIVAVRSRALPSQQMFLDKCFRENSFIIQINHQSCGCSEY
jgi:hypothetical protein